jgi:serine/threonine protein kinase
VSPDPSRVKALFVAALDMSPGERTPFLDRECGAGGALRTRLDALLAAHDLAAAAVLPADGTRLFTDAAPTADPDGTRDHPGPAGHEGAVIAGRYKLLQRIGEGGMGEVWMAEQTEPVRRKVALKLIKGGMDSRTVLARFAAERQAIALMDHPHIAKLLDAGATETGTPFFAMELVRGVPLTDFCDAHRLTVPDRLALFRQICAAVQHAHQKGVIHRDLKPSNVLVESHDGKAVPKVFDFGLAKATTGLPLTEHTLFTVFGSVMGTPTYMAPEQATFNAVDVDTRADVYALGVILYELLTGSRCTTCRSIPRTRTPSSGCGGGCTRPSPATTGARVWTSCST